jgi:nucleotide-binding universal stress UspA family protein
VRIKMASPGRAEMNAKNAESPRIVAGVDGSPSAEAALAWAVRQAELTGGSVTAVIAWEYPVAAGFGMLPVAYDGADFRDVAEKTVAEAIAKVTGPASTIQVQPQVTEGNAARVLLAAAEHADLLVVGSRGHSELADALLGSVGQQCVHHAHCPVLVIRGSSAGRAEEASRRTRQTV